MLDGLYCEYLKLKRTGYYACIILISFTCLYFVTGNKQLLTSLNWYGYFSHYENGAFSIFYTMIIPNLVAYIFVREFSCKTASIEFSYPKGRFGILINKFITSILVVVVIYIIGYLSIVLSGAIILKDPLTVEPLINHFKIFLISFTFQVALIPLTAIVALIGKSMIISFVYSMILIIGNVSYILGAKHKEFIFSILPAIPLAKLSSPISAIAIPIRPLITRLDICLGIIVFVIGITACILFYRKADIY